MMMKKYGLITKVLLISMFAILLSGCGNLLTSEFSSKTDETKFYTITGNIDVDAHSAKNSTRTGLPTIPSIDDNSINFSVSAKMGDKTITGEVSEMQYSITLPKGSWTITVIGKKAGVKVLEGSINVNPEVAPTTLQTITLKTIKNEGTGSLSLTISKEATLSCGGVKATLYKNSGEESNDVKYLKFNDTDNNLIQLGFNDLPAGTYSIDLEFYQEMTSSTTTEGTYSCKNLLYSHHDTVNIFANLTTDTWTGSGYSEDKTTFTLTQAMINNFAMTTFYVDADGEDTNKGTYFAPFATLQAAVNKVTEMNNVSPSNENAPYRILLLSDIEDTSTGEDIYTNDESLISIKNYPNPELYLKIASYQNDSCFKIKGASGRRIMNIQEDANVTIENITLTGGGNINDNGGGVYVAYNAIFTMGNGATISNCTGYNGGGVYVQSGTFTMNGGAISDCIAEQGGGVYVSGGTFTMENNSLISKNTSGNGGGVYVIGGTFTMTGGTISENKADCGGGIYVADTEGAQGTVVCVGQLTIEGGEISGNSAKYGGGVYIDSGDFTITGGKISENTSSIDGEGGGVYVKDGTFTIKNDALISKNTSCGNGGGVFAEGGNITINDGSISENIFSNDRSGGGGIYLTGTAKLTMTDGKISGNHPKGETSSDTFGGGVYISGESSIFTMTGGEISGNSAYYGGGVAIIGKFSMSGGTIGGETEDLACTAEKGGGVYVAYYNGTESATTFEMSGGAVISSNNDVYLAKEASIKVTGNLTGTTPVATITPNEYSTTWQVITVPVSADGTTSSVTLSEQVGKFAVTPQVEETTEETINWYIKDTGCLNQYDWSALEKAIEETSTTTSEFVLSGNLTATSTITVSGEITLKAPAGTTITRGLDNSDTAFTGAFFDNQSTLTLEGITLDGGSTGETSIQAEAPLITSSGSLTLNNCTLQNNNNSNATETVTGIYLQINDTSSLCSFNDVSFGENSSDEIPHIKIANDTGEKFTFNLGGSLAGGVPSIDMPSTTCINITESLKIPDGESIKITLGEYTIGNRIISANEGINLIDEISNFSLTTTEESWFIDSAGYLVGGSVTEPARSESGEYVVSSFDNLLWIALELKRGSITSFNIKLTEDIVIESGKWQFYQLNVSNSSTIDGQGHSITINEDVSKFGNDAGGLFYKFNNSTVKNLVLKGSITANTTESGYIGALCRSAYMSTIQNVMSTVEINDIGSGNAGGLVGYFGGNNGDGTTPATFIKNCAVYANISSENGTAGGFVGESWENTQTWEIENCIYMGAVSSKNGVAGALIGNENTGRTSYLTNIWYCESNDSGIFGKEDNKGNITQSEVESKTPADIATEAAATLLNTNSDGTSNVVWEYVSGDYPTLKSVN